MLTAAGVICMRHLLHVHGPVLCASRWGEPTGKRDARELAEVTRRFERSLVPLEDVARLQADGVALPDREAWARGRAEAARIVLVAGLKLPDTRVFHGAQEDAHGFPFYPAPPVLLTGRRRGSRSNEGGGAPLVTA